MAQIVKIVVEVAYESCQRTTYYVDLVSDEGFTKSVESHRTGSLYNDFAGLSKSEARDRALIDADSWSGFLQIPVEPYSEDGVVYLPSMSMHTYDIRRENEESS